MHITNMNPLQNVQLLHMPEISIILNGNHHSFGYQQHQLLQHQERESSLLVVRVIAYSAQYSYAFILHPHAMTITFSVMAISTSSPNTSIATTLFPAD